MAMNVSAMIHAASVLHIAIFSFAAISATVVIGFVAVNGVSPYASRANGFALFTVAAVKPAIRIGVSNAASRHFEDIRC